MSHELCDFCAKVPVTARYHAADFIVEHISTPMVVQQSVGDWAACAICEKIIDAGLWQDLALRATNVFYEDYPELSDVFPRDQLFDMNLRTYTLLIDRDFHKVKLDGTEL